MKEGNHCKSFAAHESPTHEQPLILNVLNSFKQDENVKCKTEKTQSDSNNSHESLMAEMLHSDMPNRLTNQHTQLNCLKLSPNSLQSLFGVLSLIK
jgi:hypothetical protein